MACSISLQDTFGPSVANGDCHQGFDFTLLFEETILGIAPLAITLLILPFRIIYLARCSRKVRLGWLYILKLANLFALESLYVASIIILARSPAIRTRASITLGALNIGGVALFAFLSHFEHIHSVQPSALLSSYLAISVFLDAIRARTLWAIANGQVVAIFTIAIVGLKLWVLLFESIEKKHFLEPGYATTSSEALGGIFSQGFFWWLNPLLLRGFKRILMIDNLDEIDETLLSDEERTSLQPKWQRYNQKKSQSLLLFLVSEYRWELLACVFSRLCLTGFTFAQPFLVSRIVDYISEPDTPNSKSIGYGLIAAMAIVYGGLAFSSTAYQHKTYRTITMVRGSLVSLIYHKTMNISASALDSSAAVTLMSADVERVGTGMRWMHEVWASSVDISLALWLLKRQLGVASVAPAGLFFFCTLAALKTATGAGRAQKLWLERIQERISATTSMLGSMKGVKMSGLTSESSSTMKSLRLAEMKASKMFKYLLVVIVALSYITTALAPVVAFAAFVLKAKADHTTSLNTNNAYTSLTLFSLLRRPMTLLIEAVSGIFSTTSCLERIRIYLISESRTDYRSLGSILDESKSSEKLMVQSQEKLQLTQLSLTDNESLCFPGCIHVSQMNAGWEAGGPPLLKDLAFDIYKAQLTMIIGPVGCGKSTLLKALLGETPQFEGFLRSDFADSAFCSQTPWLINATIKENILGVSMLNEIWYKRVIYACGLESDLAHLLMGDQTVIGSKGAALSGGQQARVALARAVYSKKNIVILDDVLSGLDPETEEHLFIELFGPNGLFRQERMTVIMTTNAIHRISSADHIVVLGKNGNMLEQGSFDELSSSGGYVQALALNNERGVADLKGRQKPIEASLSNARNVSPSNAMDRQKGNWATYTYFINMVGWWNVLIFLALSSSFIFCISFPQIWIGWWATANTKHPNQRIGYYIGIYAGLSVSAVIFLILSAWHLLVHIVPESSIKSHTALLNTVLNAPMSFFDSTDVGTIANRFSQDLQLIDMEVPLAIFNTAMELLTCVAQALLIATTAKYISPAVPVCLFVFWMIQKFYLRTSRQLRLLEIEAKSPLFSRFIEALGGLETIRAFQWEREFERRNSEVLNISQKPYYLLYCVQRWLNLVLELTVAVFAVLLTVVVVVGKGRLDADMIGVALVNVVGFSASIKSLMTNWTILETSIGSVQRVSEFVQHTPSEHRSEENQDVSDEWPMHGRIDFRNVVASYGPRSVLNDISVVFEAGEKIAICGRTGSGKSSLVSTLLRILNIDSGSITIDGVDISTIPKESVRTNLIALPQQACLIHGSVRHNVDPWQQATDDEILEVLTRVGMKSIVLKDRGLDAILSDNSLSHGQRQLISLARAMLRKSSILVLDEATSNVDFETDMLVQTLIREHFESHTVIAVAHRLEGILDFDKVMYMENGRVVEFASPTELLSKPSAFRESYKILRGEIISKEEL